MCHFFYDATPFSRVYGNLGLPDLTANWESVTANPFSSGQRSREGDRPLYAAVLKRIPGRDEQEGKEQKAKEEELGEEEEQGEEEAEAEEEKAAKEKK